MDIFDKIDKYQKEIDRVRPLEGHLLDQIKDCFRIGLTYSSNAIEGNTFTESETKVVLEEGITIGGKPLKDHMEAIGHSQAFDFLFTCSKKDTISEDDIKELYRLFYYRIDLKEAGNYRKKKVFITGSKYTETPPEAIDEQMKDFLYAIPQMRSTSHPVEFAAQVHKKLVFHSSMSLKMQLLKEE